jgi:predicted alpha/beta hydrolase
MYALTAHRRRHAPSVARSPSEQGEPLTLRPFANGILRERYGRALPPVHLLAAAGDSFATDAAMQRLQDALAGSAVTRHRIDPAATAQRRLGHFGLLRDEARALWPQLLALAVSKPEVQA